MSIPKKGIDKARKQGQAKRSSQPMKRAVAWGAWAVGLLASVYWVRRGGWYWVPVALVIGAVAWIAIRPRAEEKARYRRPEKGRG